MSIVGHGFSTFLDDREDERLTGLILKCREINERTRICTVLDQLAVCNLVVGGYGVVTGREEGQEE